MAKFTRAEIRKILGDAHSEEIENQIFALHLSVVDGLKDEIDKYKVDAEKLPEIQKELDKLKEHPAVDYKKKYEDEHSAFEDYKKGIDAEKAKTAKNNAAKAYFEGKNITGTNLEIAMRGAKEEIDALVLEDGKIKDTAKLDALIGGTYAGLVVEKSTTGVQTATPPSNNSGKVANTRAAQLYKEHYEQLYGKGENAK